MSNASKMSIQLLAGTFWQTRKIHDDSSEYFRQVNQQAYLTTNFAPPAKLGQEESDQVR